MEISCFFTNNLATPNHVVLAERLGYRRAWCSDSPALYSDVWMTLARAADRTHRIQLGAGVLIPRLRHVMVNATAIATLAALAPGRVCVGIGTGHTGSFTMGEQPVRWAEVSAYIRALRGLLRGEAVDWNGSVIQMMHPTSILPRYPVEVPIVVAALGPKGESVARELGDGIYTVVPRGGFSWVAQLMFGTVLDPGESAGSERALAAAGPGAAMVYHGIYYGPRPDDLAQVPGGSAWRHNAEQLLENTPERTRHLPIHQGFLVELNDVDRDVVNGDVLSAFELALDVSAWHKRLADMERAGVTEVVYHPMGPDIERELISFAKVAGR